MYTLENKRIQTSDVNEISRRLRKILSFLKIKRKFLPTLEINKRLAAIQRALIQEKGLNLSKNCSICCILTRLFLFPLSALQQPCKPTAGNHGKNQQPVSNWNRQNRLLQSPIPKEHYVTCLMIPCKTPQITTRITRDFSDNT